MKIKPQMGMMHSIITETKCNCQNNKRRFCSSPGAIWERNKRKPQISKSLNKGEYNLKLMRKNTLKVSSKQSKVTRGAALVFVRTCRNVASL